MGMDHGVVHGVIGIMSNEGYKIGRGWPNIQVQLVEPGMDDSN
jgi:hypothetical protein